MWQKTVLSLVAFLISFASLPTAVQGDSSSRLMREQELVNFDVMLGRIRALHVRGGEATVEADTDKGFEYDESLWVNPEPIPSVRYQRTKADEELVIEFTGTRDVQIRHRKQAESRVEFFQRGDGPLILKVTLNGEPQVFTGASLWHLILEHAEACETHLLPTLALLKPDWRLLQNANRIEHELLSAVDDSTIPSRREVLMLVRKLGRKDFSERQSADQALRAYGITVLPYLSEAQAMPLTGEQRVRLDRIRKHACPPQPDTAQRVASWLSTDRQVWFVLLDRFDLWKRQLAVQRLESIAPGRIQFDPAGTPEERREQLARLRTRFR